MTDASDVMAITRQQRAVLNFPDPRTSWAVVAAAWLDAPVGDELDDRLAAVHAAVPMVGARLTARGWQPGPRPPVVSAAEPGLTCPSVWHRFVLERESPLRVTLADGGRLLVLTGHHAAFDGLALVRLLTALTGGEVPQPAPPVPPGATAPPWGAVRRLLAPADPVARSHPAPEAEAFATRSVRLAGERTTARIAAACAAATGDHTRARDKPWRRVGISLGVGGPPGVGNVASYRRVDIGADEDVEAAVVDALKLDAEPMELTWAPRALGLLRPIADRFSDSFLVSNVGVRDVRGATALAFFPVARGGSAVAFGAAGLVGGPSTLTIRAAHLSSSDAAAVLDAAVARVESRA
jgi:hypothetical protein